MKHLILWVLPFVLVAGLMTACRKGSGAITTAPSTEVTVTTAATTAPTTAPATVPTTEATSPTVTMPTDTTDGTDITTMPTDSTAARNRRPRMR